MHNCSEECRTIMGDIQVKPFVRCEIEDLMTGCTYIHQGHDLEDCVAKFQSLFFSPRVHKILWQREGQLAQDVPRLFQRIMFNQALLALHDQTITSFSIDYADCNKEMTFEMGLEKEDKLYKTSITVDPNTLPAEVKAIETSATTIFKEQIKALQVQVTKIAYKSCDELEGDLCEYCPLPEGAQRISLGPNGPIGCDCCSCDIAYEKYIEQQTDVCDACHIRYDLDDMVTALKLNNEQAQDGIEILLCDKCSNLPDISTRYEV